MDPLKQITAPAAEVQAAVDNTIDGYGDHWVMIDGIETKVTNRAAAEKLLAEHDALRVKIRADLDEKGIRFNPDGTDREEKVEIKLEDGTITTVGLMKPGDANYMEIGNWPFANDGTHSIHIDTACPNEEPINVWAVANGLPPHPTDKQIAEKLDEIARKITGDVWHKKLFAPHEPRRLTLDQAAARYRARRVAEAQAGVIHPDRRTTFEKLRDRIKSILKGTK